MISFYNNEIKHAYVLNVDHLEKLHALIEQKCKDVKISAICNDSVVRKFEKLPELILYENNNSKKILSLTLESGFSSQESISINFNNNWYSKPISISVTGEDAFVAVVRSAIEDILEGAKPWYSFLTRCDFLSTAFILEMTLLLLILLLQASGFANGKITEAKDLQQSAKENLVLFCFFVVPIASGFLLNKAKAFVFPRGFFKIGQQISVYERISAYQKILSLSSLLAIVFSLFIKESIFGK